MSKVILMNQTTSVIAYLDGQISVPASGQLEVPTGLISYLALEPNLAADLRSQPGNMVLSDGISTYTGQAAQHYLSHWIANGPPQISTDPLSFTLSGNAYSVAADATLPVTSEVPLFILSNPSNSTANIRILFFYAGLESTQGIVVTRGYANPTVSAMGTTIPIVNNLISMAPPTSAATVYGSPTVSANGTKIISFVHAAMTSPDVQYFNQNLVITPNNTFLITAQASNLGALPSITIHYYAQWVEA